jgi:hypothetical protein
MRTTAPLPTGRPRRPSSSGSSITPHQRFLAGVQHYRQLLARELRGDIHLGTTEDGAPLYFPPALFDTHVMIQATTGHGKTFLSRILFRELAKRRPQVAIYVDDPKHDYLPDLEVDCAALGLDERVTIFDTSDPARTPVFNPLKKNGISIEDQSAWLLSAIRSCFKQDSFDVTPQRPRWMMNALMPVIEAEGTFDDVLAMLNYQEVGVRRAFIERTTNALVRKEWIAYEDLSVTRRRDETASAFAWLRKFCLNTTLQRIFQPSPLSFDFGYFLRNAGILLQSFPRYRPLDEESVNFLRSISLQSLLAQAFHIPLGERPPLYIFLDEAEHALERDTGAIETILSEGRSLGIHLILLFHNFAQVQRSNPALLESALTKCRTKFIGGHLTQANLEVLTSELFVGEWHPHIIRDQIYALEVEPCEEVRVSRTRSRSRSWEHGCSYPYTETEGTSESETMGESSGETFGVQVHQGRSTGRSRARTVADGTAHTVMDGVADTEMEGESHSSGYGQTAGATDALGVGSSAAETTGMSMTWDPYTMGALMPNAMTTSRNAMAGTNVNDVHADSVGESAFESEGYSYMRGTTVSHADADTTSHVEAHTTGASEADMLSHGITASQSYERSESCTTGQSHAVSHGVTPSESEGESITESETVSPFMAVKKRWRVASREFLSLQDFLTTKLIKLKGQPNAHWAVQPPQGKAVFFTALFVKPLAGGRERLKEFRERVLAKPWYHRPALTADAVPAEPRAISVQARRQLSPSPAPNEQPIFWQ